MTLRQTENVTAAKDYHRGSAIEHREVRFKDADRTGLLSVELHTAASRGVEMASTWLGTPQPPRIRDSCSKRVSRSRR